MNSMSIWMLWLSCWSMNSLLTNALYDSKSDVVELTPKNFQKRVIDSGEFWVVEFYAPWCGHCKQLVPEYNKLATALKGLINVGAVDANEHKDIGGKYGVRGFPTIKMFTPGGGTVDYKGGRTASALIDAAFKELRNVADKRVGGGGGGSKSSGGSGGGSKKDVIELTDDNFKKLVLDSDDMWLVEFFAPWCGHCQRLEPEWASAASELKGKVKLGALDATVHQAIAGRYNIKGFPTIKYFPAGAKSGEAEEYQGGRQSSDIVSWALDKASENVPPPELKELVSESVLKTACDNAQICVVSFLPHILDCDAACRNKYLDVLRDVGEKFKKQKWAYLWLEAMQQPELEDALGVGGFGYPAMAALNSRKMKYSLLRGSFSKDGITEFLRDLSYGRGSSVPVKGAKLPAIEKMTAWNGKDGEPPVVEDFDEKIEL